MPTQSETLSVLLLNNKITLGGIDYTPTSVTNVDGVTTYTFEGIPSDSDLNYSLDLSQDTGEQIRELTIHNSYTDGSGNTVSDYNTQTFSRAGGSISGTSLSTQVPEYTTHADAVSFVANVSYVTATGAFIYVYCEKPCITINNIAQDGTETEILTGNTSTPETTVNCYYVSGSPRAKVKIFKNSTLTAHIKQYYKIKYQLINTTTNTVIDSWELNATQDEITIDVWSMVSGHTNIIQDAIDGGYSLRLKIEYQIQKTIPLYLQIVVPTELNNYSAQITRQGTTITANSSCTDTYTTTDGRTAYHTHMNIEVGQDWHFNIGTLSGAVMDPYDMNSCIVKTLYTDESTTESTTHLPSTQIELNTTDLGNDGITGNFSAWPYQNTNLPDLMFEGGLGTDYAEGIIISVEVTATYHGPSGFQAFTLMNSHPHYLRRTSINYNAYSGNWQTAYVFDREQDIPDNYIHGEYWYDEVVGGGGIPMSYYIAEFKAMEDNGDLIPASSISCMFNQTQIQGQYGYYGNYIELVNIQKISDVMQDSAGYNLLWNRQNSTYYYSDESNCYDWFVVPTADRSDFFLPESTHYALFAVKTHFADPQIQLDNDELNYAEWLVMRRTDGSTTFQFEPVLANDKNVYVSQGTVLQNFATLSVTFTDSTTGTINLSPTSWWLTTCGVIGEEYLRVFATDGTYTDRNTASLFYQYKSGTPASNLLDLVLDITVFNGTRYRHPSLTTQMQQLFLRMIHIYECSSSKIEPDAATIDFSTDMLGPGYTAIQGTPVWTIHQIGSAYAYYRCKMYTNGSPFVNEQYFTIFASQGGHTWLNVASTNGYNIQYIGNGYKIIRFYFDDDSRTDKELAGFLSTIEPSQISNYINGGSTHINGNEVQNLKLFTFDNRHFEQHVSITYASSTDGQIISYNVFGGQYGSGFGYNRFILTHYTEQNNGTPSEYVPGMSGKRVYLYQMPYDFSSGYTNVSCLGYSDIMPTWNNLPGGSTPISYEIHFGTP